MDAKFKEYSSGEVILAEGSTGEEVFLLVDGIAQVSVRGRPVGKIGENEIFGVSSALTGAPRTATITAESARCFAMMITKDQFRDLIKEKPDVVEKLIGDLVRIISNQNETIISIKGSTADQSGQALI